MANAMELMNVVESNRFQNRPHYEKLERDLTAPLVPSE